MVRRKLVLRSKDRGFTLIELLVAVAMFVVLTGAVMTLVSRHLPLFNAQQGQAALSISLRNAVAQMQTDVVNAGAGYYTATNVSDFPVGLTVSQSSAGTGCYDSASQTYGAGCFDTLNVITVDTSILLRPSGDQTGASIADSTTQDVFVMPPTGFTTTTLAAKFHSNDTILLLHIGTNGGTCITTATVNSVATVGSSVRLRHSLTTSSGMNNTSDLYNVTYVPASETGTEAIYNKFCGGNIFSPATDYVLKLQPITYSVDTTDATNPKLVRSQAGNNDTIAEQIIGFKVVPVVFNTSLHDGLAMSNNSFTLLRAVQVSLIGRTTPGADANASNGFDSGKYKIQAVSVTISPRNLSMND